MIALKILDIKTFMAGFLVGHLLDRYQLTDGSVTTFCTFTIDGAFQKDFYQNSLSTDSETAPPAASDGADSPARPYVLWKEVKDLCFSIIKGKRTPLAFKFVFYYPEEETAAFLNKNGIPASKEGAYGLCLNLRFDRTGLYLTTGVSMKTFSMDRTVDHAWDQYVRDFLKKSGISAAPL
jgi:hypothetical protein